MLEPEMLEVALKILVAVLAITLGACLAWVKRMSAMLYRHETSIAIMKRNIEAGAGIFAEISDMKENIAAIKTDIEWIKSKLDVR